MRRKKHFDWEEAFRFIWENADSDGIWHGGAASLAAEFDATEDDADQVLGELRTRRLIEKLYTGTFFISNWRETDDPDEPTYDS